MDHDNNYTTVFSNLDIDVRTPRYFQSPILPNPCPSNYLGQPYIASILEINANYRFYITPAGTVLCNDGGNLWCSKMGY
jgi:hypothetical protein